MRAGAASLVGGLFDRALDLVFPRRCVGCDAYGRFLCPACLAGMARAAPPRCSSCWMPARREDELCPRCQARPFAFQAARAAFVYRDTARDAVHALKYRGLSALAREMAAPMTETLRAWQPPVRAIVPVPLAGRRRRLRGYNQSQLLAKEIAALSGLPLASRALLRRRSAPPQARAADEEARRRAVAGAFAPGSNLSRESLLLVDDVLTSGATLDACAHALRQAGAGPIFALTFARED